MSIKETIASVERIKGESAILPSIVQSLKDFKSLGDTKQEATWALKEMYPANYHAYIDQQANSIF